jgi:hypothetical protein
MSLRFILTPLQPACENSVVLCLPYPLRSASPLRAFSEPPLPGTTGLYRHPSSVSRAFCGPTPQSDREISPISENAVLLTPTSFMPIEFQGAVRFQCSSCKASKTIQNRHYLTMGYQICYGGNRHNERF